MRSMAQFNAICVEQTRNQASHRQKRKRPTGAAFLNRLCKLVALYSRLRGKVRPRDAWPGPAGTIKNLACTPVGESSCH